MSLLADDGARGGGWLGTSSVAMPWRRGEWGGVEGAYHTGPKKG
jgi:hypothetical protein